MTLQQMEFFITAARFGSFTAAAKQYYTTQPTISRQVLLLEEELGYLLFNRHAKPLILTAAGQVVYAEFCKIVDDINAAIDHGRAVAEGKYGDLAIAFIYGLAIEDHFANVFEDLHQRYESFKLSFSKIAIPAIKEKLLSGQADVLISLNLSLLNTAEFEVRELFPIETYILMSNQHPLAQKEVLESDDLYNEKIFLPEPVECYSFRENTFFGFQINRQNINPVQDIDTAFLNIQFSGGVTTANNMMRATFDSRLFKKFPVLDYQYVPKVCLAWKKGNTNPAILFFSEFIEKYFKKY